MSGNLSGLSTRSFSSPSLSLSAPKMAASVHSVTPPDVVEEKTEKNQIQSGVDVDVVESQSIASEDAYLGLMGYKAEMRRDFSFFGLFSLVSSELAVLPGVAGTICACTLEFLHTASSATRWLPAARWHIRKRSNSS